MRRIKLVVAAIAVVVATFVASAGPAMALDCRNVSGPGIRCDGTRFLPVSNFNDGFFRFNNGFNTSFSPFFFNDGFNRGFGNCLFLPALTLC